MVDKFIGVFDIGSFYKIRYVLCPPRCEKDIGHYFEPVGLKIFTKVALKFKDGVFDVCLCLFDVFTGGFNQPSSIGCGFKGGNYGFDARVLFKFGTKERHLLAAGVL